MPRQLNGVWTSDDGKWTWDGKAWQPARSLALPPRWGLWRWVMVLVAVGLLFAAVTRFGWIVALVGLGLAAAALRSPSVRAWPVWRRFPFLRNAGSPAWFAAILAAYLVFAPAAVWGVALASTTGSSSGSRSDSASGPPGRPASTGESSPPRQTSTSAGSDAEAEPSSVQVATTTTLPAAGTAAACGDPQAHVYNPSRLHLLAACVTLNGTVDIIRAEKDGDLHILVRLDPGQDKYINARNISAENGDLVTEPVCERAVTQADAVGACAGYVNPILIPGVGSHVAVTGAWVLDVDHGWLEIHPVASYSTVGAAPPTSTPTATAAPTAAPTSAPTVTPTAPPPPPPPAATVTFLNAPLTVAHGQTATLAARTSPNTGCFIVVMYKTGPSTAAGLSPATSDGAGNVSWTWLVGSRTTPGTWPITVTCGAASNNTTITVT